MKILLALLLALMTRPAIATDVYTVPLDIRNHFKTQSCSEILDYYSESKVTEKPYMYGVISAATGKKMETDYSFIAWCRSSDSNAEKPYVLVAKLNGTVWPGGCTFPIRDFDYAGEISVTRQNIDLSSFDGFKRRGVDSTSVFGPLIQSERDGLVYEVFCQRGTWLKRNID